MGPQSFNGRIIPGQFGFGQGCVDFVVADLMEKHRGPALAAPEFRDKVVVALADLGRNGPTAKRADRIAHKDQSMSGPAGTIPRGLRSSEGEK